LNAKEQEANSLRNRAELAEHKASQYETVAREMAAKADALAKTLEDFSAQQSERGLVLTMGSILFEIDKSDLKPGAERTLEKVAAFLAEYSNRSVLVEGFTDSLGAADYNQNLSERRAETVVNELEKLGISSSRLSARGYGEDYPVASNSSNAGRQQNRRVELIIANQDQTAVTPRK
jgi:outer membrane protein OmpA-like peptidoglycan-associated protein